MSSSLAVNIHEDVVDGRPHPADRPGIPAAQDVEEGGQAVLEELVNFRFYKKCGRINIYGPSGGIRIIELRV